MTSTLPQTSCIQYTTMPEPGMDAKLQPWGWHLVLNLYDCNPQKIQSAEVIYDFVVELCERIEMRRFGEPMIVNFGEDPRVTGYSLVQLIETSNICGHFADGSNSAYLDIFSCKQFDPELAAAYCIQVFEAQKASATFISRD